MKTREDFLSRYLDRLVGIALTGLIRDSDPRPGPMAAGRFALALPEKIASLLDEMYSFLEPEPSLMNGKTPVRKEPR